MWEFSLLKILLPFESIITPAKIEMISSKEEAKQMQSVVDELLEHKDSELFRLPVDYKGKKLVANTEILQSFKDWDCMIILSL